MDVRDDPGRDAGAYTSTLDKGTLHTTEGGSIAGAVAAFRQHDSWPHKTCDYRKGRREVSRHLPLNRAARALRNTGAAGETNRDGTLQYEIVGDAAHILEQYDEADWIAFGHDVIGPDFRECGIPLECHVTMPTYPPPNGERLGQESTRLTRAQITKVVGLVGHCSWPENVHGDPGNLDAETLLKYVHALVDPKPKPKPERVHAARVKVREAVALLRATPEPRKGAHALADALDAVLADPQYPKK